MSDVFDPEKALNNFKLEEEKRTDKVFNPQRAISQFTAQNTVGSANVAADTTPNETAQIIDLADKSGLPKQVVKNDPQAVKKKLKVNEIQKAAEKEPILGRWMTDPENAALISDELPLWEDISNTAKSAANRGLQVLGMIPGAISTVGKDLQKEYQTGGFQLGIPKETLDAAGVDPSFFIGDFGFGYSSPEEFKRIMDVGGTDPFKVAADALRTTQFETNEAALAQWEQVKDQPLKYAIPFILEQGVVSVPDMVAAITILPAYVFGRSGELAEERAANEGRTDGEYTVGDFVKTLPAATVSALLDRYGGRGMLGLDELAVTSGKQLTKEIGKATIKEGVTEFLQENIEYAGATLGTNEGYEFEQGLDRGFAGLVAGGGFGGVIRGTTGGVELAFERNKRAIKGHAQAVNYSESLRAIFAKLDETGLSDLNQAKSRDLFQSILDGNNHGEISVNANGLVSALLSEGENQNVESIAKQLGVDRETLDIALRTGNDVKIKAGNIHDMALSDENVREAILMNVRAEEQAMTLTEAEDAMAEAKQVVEDELAADQERSVEETVLMRPVEAVYEMVKRQLQETGRFTSDAAGANAELHRSIANVLQDMFDKEGVEFNAFQFVQQMGFNIEDETKAREQLTRDVVLDAKLNELRKRKEKSGMTDLFSYIIDQGRVKPGSTFAGELMAMGITPKTRPGLFSNKGTFGDFDNVVASEFNEKFGVNAPEDANGYVNRDYILDRISKGSLDSELDAFNEEILKAMDELDLDFNTMTNEEIIQVLNQSAQSDPEIKTDVKEDHTLLQKITDKVKQFFNRNNGQDPKTLTESFKNWFKDSVAVNEDGTPQVLYHGTRQNFESFNQKSQSSSSNRVRGAIFLSPSPEFASGFAQVEDGAGGQIYPVYASLQNPARQDLKTAQQIFDVAVDTSVEGSPKSLDEFFDMIGDDTPSRRTGILMNNILTLKPEFVDTQGFGDPTSSLFRFLSDVKINGDQSSIQEFSAAEALSGIFKAAGFDGYVELEAGQENYAVFDPNQVKSVNNIGDFSTTDDRILYQTSTEATRNNIGLYSQVEQALLDMNLQSFNPSKKNPTGAAPANEILAKLKKAPGVKAEELEWSGIEEMLSSAEGKLTRNEVVDFIRNNGVQVREVVAETSRYDVEPDGLEFDEGVVWDDDDAWSHNYEDYKAYPEDFGFDEVGERDAVIKQIIEDDLDYINKALEADLSEGELVYDEDRIKYVEDEFADEIQTKLDERIDEWAMEAAKENYFQDPYFIYEAETENGSVYIFGNEDVGYTVRRDNWESQGNIVRDDIYSLSEAQIQADDWARDNGYVDEVSSDESVARWEDSVMDGDHDNYREIKLTLPGIDGDFYEHAHFPDRNIVAFLRVTDRELGIPRNIDRSKFVASEKSSENRWRVDFNDGSGNYGFADGATAEQAIKNISVNDYKKTYFIDEFQSDWHQDGRQKGYQTGADGGLLEQEAFLLEENTTTDIYEKADELDVPAIEIMDFLKEPSKFEYYSDEVKEKFKQLDEQGKFDEIKANLKKYKEISKQADAERYGVPDAPFKGNAWINLGLKRAIVDAVENGYEAIAWPNSSVLVSRWSDRYRQLYEVQYDTKMPSMVKKLTKIQPKEFDLDGELITHEKKPPFTVDDFEWEFVPVNEYINSPDGNSGILKYREDNGLDTDAPVLKYRMKGDSSWASDATPMNDKEARQSIQKTLDQARAKVNNWTYEQYNATTFESAVWKREFREGGEEGYHIIEITDKLRDDVKQVAYPLFQTDDNQVRGKFNPDTATISFTALSDKTTFLHESGHLFFEMIDRAADLPDAPDSIRAMREEMYAITGYDSLKTFEENRNALEDFAVQFEAYLETGKAPTNRLKKAFNMFRRWILDVYSKLVGQLPDLRPEMKSFFDRMLATQEELDAAEAESGLTVPEGLSDVIDPEDNQKILRLAEEAHDEGYQKQYEARLKIEKREATKQWREDLKEERGKARAELLNGKVYRARHYLMNGEFPNSETPPTLKGLKINRKQLINQFGVGIIDIMNRVPRAVTKNGINPDEIAEILGFGTAQEMIEAIAYVPGIKEATNTLADQRMLEKHGDPLNDGTLEERAIAHVAMNKRSAFLEAQAKALEKKATKTNPMTPLKVIRKTVREALQGKPLKSVLTPKKFLQASIRAGKRSEAALASGDIDTAFTEKQRQLVNYEMFRATDDMKHVVERMFKFQDRVANKSINRTYVDPEYIKILKSFALGAQNPTQANEGMISAMAWAEERMASERDIPSNILIPYDQDGIVSVDDRREWTFEQAKQANDFLKSLWKEGRGVSNEEKARLKQIDGDLAARIEQNIEGNYKPKTGKTPAGKILSKWVESYFSAHVAADQFMRQMDKYEEQGYVWSLFKGKAVEMENAEIEMKETKIPELHRIFRKYYTKKETAQNTYKKVQLSRPLIENGSPITHVTKNELLVLALNVGNPYNLEVISEGYGVSPETMMQILNDAMTEKDWKLAKDIGDYLGSFWPEIKALEERVTGVAPDQVEVHDVVTNFGTIKGWYYPIVYDKDLSGKTYTNMQAEQMKDLMGGSYGRAATKHGHTTSRVGSGGQAPLLSLSVLYSHVNNVIHDLTHREGVLELNRIMHGPDFQKAVVTKLGLPAWNQMNGWLKEIAGGEVHPHAATDIAFRYIRTATTVIGLGARLSTIAVQPLGFATSVLRIGGKSTIKGIRKFYGSPREAWTFISDRSPFMRNRINNFDRDVALIASDTEISWVDTLVAKTGLPLPRAQEIASWSFKGIAMLDMAVAGPTWMGAYHQALGELGLNEEQAIKHADAAVVESQGGGGAKDLVGIQRGTELQRALTMFYSYFIRLHQIMREQKNKLKLGQINTFQFGMALMIGYVLPSVLDGIMRGNVPDDDEEVPLWVAKQIAGYAGSTMVGTRDLVNGLLGDFGYSMTPLQSTGETLVGGAEVIGNLANEDEELTDADIAKIVKAAGIVTKLPLDAPYKELIYIKDVLNGEEELTAKGVIFNKREN